MKTVTPRARCVALGLAMLVAACTGTPPPVEQRLRVATYNVSLFSNEAGGLIRRLEGGDEGARSIAAVIQTVRPDLLLLNEFDYDEEGRAARLFQEAYLGVGQHGREPIRYPHRYLAPVNTGEPSGLDVDGDGRLGGPGDGWGFGHHPGQYGMLVLSMHPIAADRVRTFRMFRWADVPGALRPRRADGSEFYSDDTWSRLRLSSKSHWDVPIATPAGTLHFLVSHPTPPVFDGPEDHNGLRNHDEIRLWADYLGPGRASYLVDDAGTRGGLDPGARFVIAGDLNADPHDGDGDRGREALRALLGHERIERFQAPSSDGGQEASLAVQPRVPHRGDPRHDTCRIGGGVGNLRLDYVIPSRGLSVLDTQVFWPVSTHPDAKLTDGSDHHMVWLDLALPPDGRAPASASRH
jgi:endonuclease/exonuclease/phosphatase family metal-dependent hydrolase